MKFRTGVLLLASTLLLAGCSAGGGNKKEAKDDGKIKIRLLTRSVGSSPQVKVFQDTVAQFQKDHPEVKIEDDSQGDDSSFNNILKTSRASNDLPNIYRVQGVMNLSEYIDNNLVMDMTEELTKDKKWGDGFVKGAVDYYKVPGYEGVYGVPCESGLIGVYYNKDLFKKAGIDKFPETWDQMLDAVKKLNDIKVTPIALGAKTTYTVGHLHNLIFYRLLGTQGAKDLGDRKMKWTDPKVVESIDKVKDLVDAKAFDPNAVGIDDQVASTSFYEGKSAMMITGPWAIPNFYDKEKTKLGDSLDFAKFPYFTDHKDMKDEDMQVISPYQVKGGLKGKEKELTIELVKRLTDAEIAKKYADDANQIFPRTDYEADHEKATPLFERNVELAQTSTGMAQDVFDFDPLQSMQDVTRNALVGVLQGGDAKTAAKTIQDEIDNSGK